MARWYAALGVTLITAAIVLFWHPIVDLLTNADAARAWLISLGPWGPLALVLVNAVQIVVAPVPGYFVQLAGGYLFGALPGALYGTLGMLLGAATAMSISRRFGRPFVARWIGEERLQRWEEATHANSTWVWFLILLGPVGDVPYYLAGLTHVPIWKILLIATVTRGPAVGLAAAAGAGIATASPTTLAVIALATAAVALALLVFGRRISHRLETLILQRIRDTHPS